MPGTPRRTQEDRNSRVAALAILLAPVAALAAGCDARLPAAEGTTSLRANLARAGAVELAVPPELLERAAEVVRDWPLPATVRELGAPGRRAAARVIVGPVDAPEVRELLAALPLEIGEGERLELFGRQLPRDAVAAFVWADPARPGLPVTVVAGRSKSELARALAGLAPGTRPQVQVRRGGELVLEAELTPAGRLRPGTVTDRGSRWRRSPDDYRALDLEGGKVRAKLAEEVTDDRARVFAAELEAAIDRLEAWLGDARPRRLTLVLDARTDDHGTGEPVRALARYDAEEAELSALVGEELPGDARPALAELARAAAGAPGEEWLADAAATDAADRVFGHDLERWCAHLGENPFDTLDELLADDATERRSPLAVVPLRALLFRALREERGADFTRGVLWHGGAPRAGWEELLEARLAALGAEHAAELAAEREARLAAALDARWDGVAIEAPIGSPHGIGSGGFARSVRHARAAGARTALLRCHFAAFPGTGDGAPRAPDRTLATLDGDGAVLAGLSAVRAAGLRPALSVELLATPAGIHDSARVLTGGDEWAAHFERFERAVHHAALLAELGGAELLVLGSALHEAAMTRWTAGREENRVEREAREAKEPGWRRAIETARASFRGALTHSADFPARAHQVGFWSDLDLVALNLRPDLSTEGQPWRVSDENTARRLGVLLERARAFVAEECGGRPWIVGEVGFRATERAWGAGAEPGGAASPEEQARLFRALAEALEEQRDAPGAPRGVIVIGWTSDPFPGRRRGYDPRGGAAEAVLPEVFGE